MLLTSQRSRWVTFSGGKNTVVSAEQGLRRLIEGNERFVSGKARFPTV
jgi:hypothetical protein